MPPLSILVVDDDPDILKFLQTSLGRYGWEIRTVLGGEEALRMVEERLPDLVLLDIIMPKMDGFEVCKRLRSLYSVPIIMLSARGDMADKVQCLNLGADDYITKPFGLEELVARIQAVLRRSQAKGPGQDLHVFIQDSLEIDFTTRQVTVNGREIKLTATEYNLLQELVAHAGQILSHRDLLMNVWGPEYKIEREYLHVYIGRLRAKIEPDPKKPRYIINVPGKGYMFQAVPQSQG
jgi:two-component system KDP operon response regulator KdpE